MNRIHSEPKEDDGSPVYFLWKGDLWTISTDDTIIGLLPLEITEAPRS